MTVRVGIIGGTGLYSWPRTTRLMVESPFGDVALWHARTKRRELFFVARHGEDHSVAPHAVDARATISALRAAGCTYVLAVNNCGSLVAAVKPGTFVVPDDLIDRTHGRKDTFHEAGDVVHVQMSPAYCPTASERLAKVAGATLGTYVAVQGPRFETPAEARMHAAAGGTIVGMTGYPEVALAREAGMHYACLAYVANHAANLGAPRSASTIRRAFEKGLPRIRTIVSNTITKLPEAPTCTCLRGLAAARLTRTSG